MKIQTKYKNGEYVWFMHGNRPHQGMIEKITVTEVYNKHSGAYNIYVNYSVLLQHSLMVYSESSLYKTYEELLESLKDHAEKL